RMAKVSWLERLHSLELSRGSRVGLAMNSFSASMRLSVRFSEVQTSLVIFLIYGNSTSMCSYCDFAFPFLRLVALSGSSAFPRLGHANMLILLRAITKHFLHAVDSVCRFGLRWFGIRPQNLQGFPTDAYEFEPISPSPP